MRSLVPALLCTTMVLSATPAAGVAQAREGTPSRSVLAPVQVQATRLPGTATETPWPVSVVRGDDVSAGRQGLGLDEALLTVPGLYAQNRYNFAQDLRLSIRGFGARSTFGIRGVRLLVDGMPSTLADGQSGVDDLDLLDLDRIEVIRGPAASLYGSSAGGVLRLTSAPPPARPEIRTSLAAGSFGFAAQRLRAGGTGAGVAGVVTASHQVIEGARQNSRGERSLLRARGSVAMASGAELAVNLSAVDSPTAEDPGGLTAAERNASRHAAGALNVRFHTGEAVAQERIGLRYTQDVAGGELTLRTHALVRDFDSRLPFQTVALDRIAAGAGAEYVREVTAFGRPLTWLAGLELQHQDDDRQRRVNRDGVPGRLIADQRETVGSAGTFLHTRLRASDRLLLTAGVRADRVRVRVDDRFAADGIQGGSAGWSALSPSAGGVFTLADTLDVYLNAATAFETPTTAELASPTGGGGINTALDAQRSQSMEAGVRGWLAGGAVRHEVSVFHIRVEDQLVAVPVAGSPGRFAFENAGRSRHVGVEASVEADATDDLSLRAAWTWSRFEYRRFTDSTGARLDGRTLPGIPRHLLALEVRWRPAPGWLLAVDGRAVSRRFADSANTAHSPGHVVMNARAAWQWQHGPLTLETAGGIDNLLDTRYDDNLRINAAGGRFFEPAPGRGAHVSVSLGVGF